MRRLRHAHPQNRNRRRIGVSGALFGVAGSAILALTTMASAGPHAVAPALVFRPIVAAIEPSAVAAAAPSPSTGVALPASPADSGSGRPVVVVPDPQPHAVPRAPAGSRVVVLGDSYSSGWNGAGLGRRNWTAIVGRSRGWTVLNFAVAGTGFLNAGWTNQPVGSLVANAVSRHPDVVFIVSGHNDSRWSPRETSRAAGRVIDRLREDLPDAVIVLVAPIWQDASPPLRCLALRDFLRRKAATIGGVFLDPLAEGWFAGANHRFIGPDRLHPTDAGHAHLAALILADLQDRLPS